MTVTTIPPGLPFADTLAGWLMERAGGDPLALAAMEVLLPTRRSCRALADAFLRLSDGSPLLLPRMRTLGDMDEEELALSGPGEPLDLPPSLSGLERRLILARLITAMAGARGGPAPAPDQAVRLAAELAGLQDHIQAERLDFARLESLVPTDYAAHWQVTLDFLKILTRAWPAILAEKGALDPEDRLNKVMAAQSEAWRHSPPSHPIIAAGSTGSRPATAELLAAVAALRGGMVVLPGLDRELDAESWDKLEPTHPQYGLKRLLGRLGVERDEVAPLVDIPDPRVERTRLVAEAMRPAEACEAWRDLPKLEPSVLEGVSRLDLPGPREEAGVIALMLRQSLETEGHTAALVTPDRALARRVASEMDRWGIRIDDSAGQSLGLTEPGAFLRLTARMVAEQFAPHATLACLKHPLAAAGLEESRFRALVRHLEISALRGPRPAPGASALASRVTEPRLTSLLADMETLAAPFAALLASDSAPLADLARTHMEFAEALAADDRMPGPARLWKGEAGEASARFAAELVQAAPALGTIGGRFYPALLDELMAGQVVRSAWDHHPRLFIWGPLEARLQHCDLMILGGLNEGVWPAPPDADPWMSRPMRQDFGLEPPERRVGLSAHDVQQCLGAPRVVLTRAMKADGAPTVPSRWLMRLDAVMTACGLAFQAEEAALWMEWLRLLDHPGTTARPEPPAPRPPVSARPRRLSVTEIETWMRDPYAVYAKHVLGLKALDPIDDDPGAAEYGSLVHLALERFARAYPQDLPLDAEARLEEIGRTVFEDAMAQPSVWAFWWPRFQSIARWVVARERQRRPLLTRIHPEVKGALELDAPAGPFTLVAKADRVDVRRDGGLELIDFKTGQPPSVKEVAAGFAPQLPLEAAIARLGGFEGVPPGRAERLLYWRLKGGAEGGEERTAGDDPHSLAEQAVDGLAALVTVFDNPDTPYGARPHPEHAPRYSDYLHLARVREWASGVTEAED